MLGDTSEIHLTMDVYLVQEEPTVTLTMQVHVFPAQMQNTPPRKEAQAAHNVVRKYRPYCYMHLE